MRSGQDEHLSAPLTTVFVGDRLVWGRYCRDVVKVNALSTRDINGRRREVPSHGRARQYGPNCDFSNRKIPRGRHHRHYSRRIWNYSVITAICFYYFTVVVGTVTAAAEWQKINMGAEAFASITAGRYATSLDRSYLLRKGATRKGFIRNVCIESHPSNRLNCGEEHEFGKSLTIASLSLRKAYGKEAGTFRGGEYRASKHPLFSYLAPSRCYTTALFSSSSSKLTPERADQSRGNFSSIDSEKGAVRDIRRTDVPLVFVPGMKGTHLARIDAPNESGNKARESPAVPTKRKQGTVFNWISSGAEKRKKRRVWLTLSGVLNFPRRTDNDPDRSLALPLTYSEDEGGNKVQDKGSLIVDGTVDHIIELGPRTNDGEGVNVTENSISRGSFGLEFFPFYGHVTKHLEEVNTRYRLMSPTRIPNTNVMKRFMPDGDNEIADTPSGINQTKNWKVESQLPNPTQTFIEQEELHSRPTATFPYDWRRSLHELSAEFHTFCEDRFPGQPVQVVAHSLGGLIAFGAMRTNPEKYRPGGVFVGVPFGTGIQYLQDMHKGYFTELGRCRQFLPPAQFTFSSHWSFFPMNDTESRDLFVDVTNMTNVSFIPDQSSIGKPGSTLQRTVRGDNIILDFYDPESWEKHEFGIFSPEYRKHMDDKTIRQYKEHMKIQMEAARKWRNTVLGTGGKDSKGLPPLVICATNTVPTVNQVLRRKRIREDTLPSSETSGYSRVKGSIRDRMNNFSRKDKNPTDKINKEVSIACSWEYDYISGRSVPGDGRIDYVKAFPTSGVLYKEVCLNSTHAKQMCWEENGGNWGRIWKEVAEQIRRFHASPAQSKETESSPVLQDVSAKQRRKFSAVHPKVLVMRVRKWREKKKLTKGMKKRSRGILLRSGLRHEQKHRKISSFFFRKSRQLKG